MPSDFTQGLNMQATIKTLMSSFARSMSMPVDREVCSEAHDAIGMECCTISQIESAGNISSHGTRKLERLAQDVLRNERDFGRTTIREQKCESSELNQIGVLFKQ